VNILQVVPKLESGGVETGVVDLARELISRGHKAVVISSGGELVKELDSIGARHYILPVHSKNPYIILRMIGRITEVIRKERIDIVHARSRACAWSSYFACLKTGCNFITTCHGYYNTHFMSRVMGWGKRVIVPSVTIGRHMIDDFGVSVDVICHIPRGVDLERFQFNPSYLRPKTSFTVGIIARLTPIKGHKYFLKAISKIVRKIPEIRAVIIGEASADKQRYKEELIVLIRQLGISSYVEFLGRRSDIPQLLSELDVLVMATTTQEAFGRVLIEAGAVGIPVIGTKVGGIVEIIEDNKDGLLVQPEDPEAIAEAILRLYHNKDLVKRFVQRARKKVEERFSLEKMAEDTINLYSEVVNSFKILVIKISSLGDVILVIPSLRALRARFKTAHISLLVDLRYKDVLQNCPYIDELLSYDIKDTPIFSKRFNHIAKSLRKEHFDCIVDLQNNAKSHLLGFLSMSPKRYGYRNKKLGFLLNNGIKDIEKPQDPISHQGRLLNILGIDIIDRNLCLWPKEEDRAYVENLLAAEWLGKNQELVGLNISASKRWQTKRWPLKKFAKLSDRLVDNHNVRILITGDSYDRQEAENLARLTKSKPIITCGKTTLLQFAALVSKCKVLITTDTAAMHIAAAMKTPFVALFGPTDPERHLPPAENYTLIYKRLKCSPCYKPRCKSLECMEKISVDEVYAAASKWIRRGRE